MEFENQPLGENMIGPIGILMPNVSITRLPGDVGNPDSFDCPTLFHVVDEVTEVGNVVSHQVSEEILKSYLSGALRLQERGATVITTTCGFLSVLQSEISSKLRIPFVASSLLQVPLVYALTLKPVCIVTADASVLSTNHLQSAGIGEIPVVVRGLEEFEEFSGSVLRPSQAVEFESIRRIMESVAQESIQSNPDIGSFVFECHNLAPYRSAVQTATHRPVFDIISLVTMIAHATEYLSLEQRVLDS